MKPASPEHRTLSPSAGRRLALTLLGVIAVAVGLLTVAATTPLGEGISMFGGEPSRNMAAEGETGSLPASWDIESGENVLWTAALGSQSYGGPVLAGDKIYVGTNNEARRDPDITGDKGVLMAFDRHDGTFLWQGVHDKLPAGKVHDWPLQGICSAPYVEGDRLWYVSNRAQVVCADTEGFRDGTNDGPFEGEARKGEDDEDILWSTDMIEELGVFPHNLAAGNPLVVGDILYTVTGNGVDEGHINIPAPLAPSFLALDKNTGEVLWESNLPGTEILHGSWSNPAYGEIGGRDQVVFPGGDGWLYAFEPKTGELLWSFDCNPKDSEWKLGGAGTRNNLVATPVIWDGKVYIGVGQDPEHGEAPGHLWVVDPTKVPADQRGERQELGDGAIVWNRSGDDFNRTISTVAIADGVLYAADLSGFLYALDPMTGEHFWTYDAFAAVWGSPFVADGKVYLGDEDGDIAILEAGKTKKLLGEINLGRAVYTTPIAQDGVLYIASRDTLYALKEGAGKAAPAKPETAEEGGSEAP